MVFFKKKNLNSHISNVDRINKLSKKQIPYFEFLIAQYKNLSNALSNSPSHLDAFLKRFDNTAVKKDSMDIFLKAEVEAVKLFRKKIDTIRNTQLKDDSDKPSFEEPSKLNRDIKKYPRIFIHHKADEEIERLYGCFLLFEKKFMDGLLESTKIITSAEYNEIIYSIKYMIEDFTNAKNKALPLFFYQYSFELDKISSVEKKLDIEILKKTKSFFEKIRKVILWSSQPLKDSTSPKVIRLPHENKRIEFQDFFKILKKETIAIIKDFNLENSTL